MDETFFDQPVKNNLITCHNIWKVATGQRDDYTRCILDYNYFNNYNKMIAVDLSKQQALDVDPKAIQQMNLTANLDWVGNTFFFFFFFHYWRSKRNNFRFFKKNC